MKKIYVTGLYAKTNRTLLFIKQIHFINRAQLEQNNLNSFFCEWTAE